MSAWFLIVITLHAPIEQIQMHSQYSCVLQMSAQFYREAIATTKMKQYSMCHNAITGERIYPDDVSYELIAIRRAGK